MSVNKDSKSNAESRMKNLIPSAPNKPKTITKHGDTREDPWFWLRDLGDPATMDYLEAENSYTDVVMSSDAHVQERVYQEMRGRIKEDDSTVPEKDGDYYYYTSFEEGKQYPIYCRKYLSLDGVDEVLIDVNEIAQDLGYCKIGNWKNSPDHNLLAYSLDSDGSEMYTIRIKDLRTGELLSESIPGTYYSLEWANDNSAIYYDVLDENHRPVKIYKHQLGDDHINDQLIYEEKDSRFFVGMVKSASKRFIFITSSGNNMSEWYFMEADVPNSKLTLIEPRSEDFEYDVEHHGDRFFIRNNGDGAKDFKVSETPISSPKFDNWTDFVSHESGRPIAGIFVFEGYFVLYYRAGGLPRVKIMNLITADTHDLQMDEEDYSLRVQGGREWDSSVLRYSYASLTTPTAVYDYDMGSRKRELRKQIEVLGGFCSEKYRSRRVFAIATDGARIPISILCGKDTLLDGSAPLYLYGYGSYGLIIESDFGSARLSLVDRGYVFAIAHVRGGMDLGWDWYEDGKLLNKKNTFTDFIACAEHLISAGYTTKGQIVASGGSAGGMLMGAVANMRPDLFKAIVADVPFVDVLNTMLDDSLPLTTMEYNEWGNPQERDFYDYIHSYSPYDNVCAQEYPHMLVTGGISDPRVTYWEPAKWTARLRDKKTDDHLLLLKIHMDSGHAGASGRFDRLREVALEYAFILKVFGI